MDFDGLSFFKREICPSQSLSKVSNSLVSVLMFSQIRVVVVGLSLLHGLVEMAFGHADLNLQQHFTSVLPSGHEQVIGHNGLRYKVDLNWAKADPDISPVINSHAMAEGKDENHTEVKCLICQENYEEGEELRCLPCQHCFHKDCVDTWLSTKDTCAFCRKSIESE